MWALLGLYAGWLVVHARAQIAVRFEVYALGGRLRPPYPDFDGDVIDPRPGFVAGEIAFRYGRRPDAVDDDTPEMWRRALVDAGYRVEILAGYGDGIEPRIVFTDTGPRLCVSAFGRRPVVFDPRRGVVLLDPQPRHRWPAIGLPEAREAPW